MDFDKVLTVKCQGGYYSLHDPKQQLAEGVLEEMFQKTHDVESASSVETVLPPKRDLIQAVFTLYRIAFHSVVKLAKVIANRPSVTFGKLTLERFLEQSAAALLFPTTSPPKYI